MNRLLFLLFALFVTGCSGVSSPAASGDSAVPAVPAEDEPVREYLDGGGTDVLLFPNRIRKIYAENGYRYLWAGQHRQVQVREALMTLDCVIQFGLTPELYHPGQLTSEQTGLLSSGGAEAGTAQARADVLLTDAMLAFMFHLHYGRFNPKMTMQAFDRPDRPGVSLDSVLLKALASGSFRETILEVQPQSRGYRLLQDYQRLLSSQYTGDRYEIHDDTLRLIAANLERYRWHQTEGRHYIEINIPSYRLEYVNGTIRERFRVIVGKPVSPTPVLEGRIKYFKTAPDWTVPAGIFRKEILPGALADPGYLDRNKFTIYNDRGEPVPTDRSSLLAIRRNPSRYVARQSSGCDNALGRILFFFDNPYSVYLHDTPARHLFDREYRALSHGCIRVENAGRLAGLLLDAEAAPRSVRLNVERSMEAYSAYRHDLKIPVPVLIRYITCEVEEGILIHHPDVYDRDKRLVEQLFGRKERS